MNKNFKFLFAPMAVLAASLASCNPAGEPIITYTLDSDIVVKRVNTDIEIVEDFNLPGKSIAHKDRSNADFNIMAFTDLHLDHYQKPCNYTFSMLARNIMHANPKPDLIVFCGDNITSSLNEPRTIQFAELLERLGVYWCAVLGNHEKNATNPKCIERDRMIDIWCQYPHCLIDNKTKTVDGEIVWGIGNSLVNLVSNKGVTQSLYFLDSGTEMTKAQMEKYKDEIEEYKEMGKASKTETEFYDYIKDSQCEWYKETFMQISKISKKQRFDPPHSTIFTHVPLMEQEDGYLRLFNAWEDEQGLKLQTRTGSANMRAFTDYPQEPSESSQYYAKPINELYGDNNGFVKGKYNRRREGLCYSPHDLRRDGNNHTPIFSAMNNFGPNNAFFCGHDHSNNYIIKWDGQFLGYIQAGCYSSNSPFTKGLLGKDPYQPESTTDKFANHLIQGYSQISYKNDSGTKVKNVINSIEQVENYNAWKYEKPDLYKRILDIAIEQYRVSKHKEYKDVHENYLIDDIK